MEGFQISPPYGYLVILIINILQHIKSMNFFKYILPTPNSFITLSDLS